MVQEIDLQNENKFQFLERRTCILSHSLSASMSPCPPPPSSLVGDTDSATTSNSFSGARFLLLFLSGRDSASRSLRWWNNADERVIPSSCGETISGAFSCFLPRDNSRVWLLSLSFSPPSPRPIPNNAGRPELTNDPLARFPLLCPPSLFFFLGGGIGPLPVSLARNRKAPLSSSHQSWPWPEDPSERDPMTSSARDTPSSRMRLWKRGRMLCKGN